MGLGWLVAASLAAVAVFPAQPLAASADTAPSAQQEGITAPAPGTTPDAAAPPASTSASSDAPTAVVAGASPTAPSIDGRISPAFPGSRGTLLLRGGGRLIGLVVSLGGRGDVVELPTRQQLRLAPRAIEGVEGPPRDDRELPEIEVTLSHGQVVSGRPVARDAAALTLLSRGGRITVALADVVEERLRILAGVPIRTTPVADPVRGRHLASPSALGLRRGEATIALLGVVQPWVSLGVLDHLSVHVASLVPVVYGRHAGANAVVSARASLSPDPTLHLAAGVQAATDSSGTVLALLAAATVGSADGHATLYVGPPPLSAAHLGAHGDVIVALSGTLRLGSRFALVTDHWVSRELEGFRLLDGLALRAFTRRVAVDAGLLAASGGGAGAQLAPWIGLSASGFPLGRGGAR